MRMQRLLRHIPHLLQSQICQVQNIECNEVW
jgi:hypothetical protein